MLRLSCLANLPVLTLMNERSTVILLSRRFGHVRKAGDEYIVCCPFCDQRGRSRDDNYKLYINVKKNLAHCFRCDYASRATDLLPTLTSFGFDSRPAEASSTSATEPLEGLPTCYHVEDLPADNVAREYVESRGFRPSEFPGTFLFCPNYLKNNYSFGPRLILPVWQAGNYCGFQARALGDHRIKYLNASGMDKSKLLYNYDVAIKQTNELIITEGIFDCLKAGPTAVAAFGKAISEHQLRLISLHPFKRIIILLDEDAYEDAKKLAKQLSLHYQTYVTRIPQKPGEKIDPGKLSTNEIRLLVDNPDYTKRIY